ncbi:unnamed protein product [Ixodes pacificus]
MLFCFPCSVADVLATIAASFTVLLLLQKANTQRGRADATFMKSCTHYLTFCVDYTWLAPTSHIDVECRQPPCWWLSRRPPAARAVANCAMFGCSNRYVSRQFFYPVAARVARSRDPRRPSNSRASGRWGNSQRDSRFYTACHNLAEMSENKPDAQVEERSNQDPLASAGEEDRDSGAASAAKDDEANGDGPAAKKSKVEPARTSSGRPQRESKAAASRRLSHLEAAAKEGEALLKELGHKDSSDPDSGRRRTRSQTRGTAPTPARQQRQQKQEPARRTAKQPRAAAKKAAAKRQKKQEEEEEEEEEEAEEEREEAKDKKPAKESKEHATESKTNDTQAEDKKEQLNNKEDAAAEKTPKAEKAALESADEKPAGDKASGGDLKPSASSNPPVTASPVPAASAPPSSAPASSAPASSPPALSAPASSAPASSAPASSAPAASATASSTPAPPPEEVAA